MKALISVVALALGSAAVFLIVTIQNNPLAFTRLDPEDTVVAVPAEPRVRIGTTVKESIPESVAVWLEETRIVGSLPQATRVAPTEEPEPEVTVLPAPCNNGEYRLLDEQRGVRLMCNVTP